MIPTYLFTKVEQASNLEELEILAVQYATVLSSNMTLKIDFGKEDLIQGILF